ncbi:uncharacterized protein LOC126788779 [Argentina anserina]|uniref:uncharacterized protein LOC126788779 n=1 Tax=Argentina anserina TaxID=57926 RepID=UPI0021764CE2|nr:uncharacterized protein LOC126788779 [Potentilla anserina]
MGNCCLKRDSVAVWANDDDDWVNVCQLHQTQQLENQKLLGDVQFRSLASSSSCRRRANSGAGDNQMKIKMTKRELEDLVGSRGGAMNVSSVEQFLAMAINDGEDEEAEEHQGPWRPALQSIPEVD